jgi:Na+/H+ antiporter NhaD/arsenite permease-like protein
MVLFLASATAAGQTAAGAYWGIGIVAAVVFLLLAIAFIVDARFELRNWDPLGYWIMRWSREYPAWVFFFSLVLGAMVGHLFTKPEIFPLKETLQSWLHLI